MIYINEARNVLINPDNILVIRTKEKTIHMEESFDVEYDRPLNDIMADIIRWNREKNVRPYDLSDGDKARSQYNIKGFKHDV